MIILGVGAASGIANIEYGSQAVLTAGLKQCAYSTLSAVVLLSIYNKLAEKTRESVVVAELIPVFSTNFVDHFSELRCS